MREQHIAFFCVSCEREMSYLSKMYSHGRCPHCSFKSPRSRTIVETFELSYKLVRDTDAPWWKFGARRRKFAHERANRQPMATRCRNRHASKIYTESKYDGLRIIK